MTVLLSNIFDRFIVDSAVQPLQESWEQWLAEHWWVAFLLHHPLALLALIGVLVFLVSGVFRALSRTSENFWLFLVKMPFRVLGWLGVRGMTWLRQNQPKPEKGDRLAELLNRLDHLREEQETILQEVKTLLKDQTPDPKA